jgi:hypothetical protein
MIIELPALPINYKLLELLTAGMIAEMWRLNS